MRTLMSLLVRFFDYWNKAASNNLHNYIALSFLGTCLITIYATLGMSLFSWWRALPPPPKELFTLLEMELFALGGFAGINATTHTVKAVAGKPGLNTPPEPDHV